MAVRTGQTAFQHLKYTFVPCGDLVPIGVLEGCALNAGMCFCCRHPARTPCGQTAARVAGRRGAHHAHKPPDPRGPRMGLQHVRSSVPRVLPSMTQRPSSRAAPDALGDGNSAVQIGLAGAGGPSLDVPAVGAIAKELLLKLSQWHCPHLPAACGQLPVHPLPGPPARSPRPASSAAPRRHGHHRAWRLQ